ncbi:hypothetical protein [Variovorax sp. OV329]|uniref:hypothetical protein n=1 Tax=Variovorax sp. OV329 TaxID=1882825 RepID=UPI0008F3A8C6|nr:hypothetical protein [Variovorax sp. OV329]SFN50983.1 hypothetical protein SAMN05444747_1323 [Variovorax sp. OV329]
MNAIASDPRAPHALSASRDFSVVMGGPLYQLLRRGRLTGDALEMQHRRVIAAILVAWMPLLVLSSIEGHVWPGSAELPFLLDIELHVRLLIALPLLIFAELFVYQRMRTVTRQFLERSLVPDAARARFDKAIAATVRLRNSVAAEVALLVFVYGVLVILSWRTQLPLAGASWYGDAINAQMRPTLAGWWLGCISLPLFQFLLLRWYYRLFIWARFLWQVSRIRLDLMPAHPDRCGGLGFLAGMGSAFAPVLLAQSTVLAGMMADQILFADAKLPDFTLELVGIVALMVLLFLGPLLVFCGQMAAAKSAGLRDYGLLAHRYVREFDQKWLRGGAPADEQLLGSGDIGSLADVGSGLETVKSMRVVPFSIQTALQLALLTLLPVLPLTLTLFSVEELLQRLLKIVF